MRKIMIVVMLVLALLMAEAQADIYPLAGRVIDVDYDDDCIKILDPSGNEWIWDGAEDWEYGDLVALLMYDEGTEIIWDDSIVEIRYLGGSY